MEELKDLLDSYCDQYDIDLTDNQKLCCLKHLELVIEKNKQVNLTRILNPKDAVSLHILDSLLLLDSLNKAPNGPFLDMGTGAGFPGIPLSIASGRSAVLIDSVGKKVDAVNGFISELSLDECRAVHERLEVAANTYKGSFAAVTARAVASLPVLIEYATPFLMKDGLFIVAKANPEDDELNAGSKAAKICGLDLIDTKTFDLPDSLGHRTVLIYRKARKPSNKLPRANGLARKNPLA